MSSWPPEASSLRALECIATLSGTSQLPDVMRLMTECSQLVGAESATFTSCLRVDTSRASYRSLLTCDPAWGSRYAAKGWQRHDPWLGQALRDSEPVLLSEIPLATPDEFSFAQHAAECGFRSGLLVPAPSCLGPSRIGVLCIGSTTPARFERSEPGHLRLLARSLAMELHRWLLQSIRAELLEETGLTAKDLDLLAREHAGQGSKAIGAALGVEPTTIDCRFQRICSKLAAPNRRVAAQIARVHGLL